MPSNKSDRVVRDPREGRRYLAKAQQFAEEARAALDASRHDAAMLTAVHAAISAADAICVALGGVHSVDTDHRHAAVLLKELAGSDPATAKHVRQFTELMNRKHVTEYESRAATAREARDAVERAHRFLGWAEGLVLTDKSTT